MNFQNSAIQPCIGAGGNLSFQMQYLLGRAVSWVRGFVNNYLRFPCLPGQQGSCRTPVEFSENTLQNLIPKSRPVLKYSVTVKGYLMNKKFNPFKFVLHVRAQAGKC